IAAGRQDDALSPETVQGAVFQRPGDDAPARAFLHDQVDREILDEELDIVLEALLIERVQEGMTGFVGGSASAHRWRFAEILHMAAEWPLVDAAIFGTAKRHPEM